MRVLLAVCGEYPHIGGLSTHMQLIGKGLSELGHEVEYLSFSDLNRVARLALIDKPAGFLYRVSPPLGATYREIAVRLLFSMMLESRIQAKDFDFISLHHVSSVTNTGRKGTRRRIPTILTVHTYYVIEVFAGIARKDSFFWNLAVRREKRAYGLADSIIAVDNRLKEYLVSMSVPRDQIEVIYNPVDTQVFHPRSNKDEFKAAFGIPNKRKVVVCARRLEEKNGVVYPILACKYLKQWVKDFVLVYAGDGPERHRMEKLVRHNKLNDYVLMLGALDHGKMHQLLSAADLAIIPSVNAMGLEEATSISALEAMASGIPVVASSIGGLRDIIVDGVNGILVPEKRPLELALAIKRLLDENDTYRRIAENSPRYAQENFSYVSRAEALVRIANCLIAKTRVTSE